MKLFGFPPSPNVWKVLATAHHMGVPLELQIVDLTKGEQRKPEYLALNPTGRVPTLVDGDLVLWESSAIMQYLGSKCKTSLWPDGAKKRADIMRWQSWHLQHWSRGANPFCSRTWSSRCSRLASPIRQYWRKPRRCFIARPPCSTSI